MKKKLIIIISSVVALAIAVAIFCVVITALFNNDIKKRKKNEFVYGDFTYAIHSDDPKLVVLTGLSDLGKTKDTIVVPAQINGYIVMGFTTYYSNNDYVDFSTAKTIYLGSADYQCDRLKIGNNTTIYGGDNSLYKKVLKTNSNQYVSVNEYNYIIENNSNHDNVHQAVVTFEYEYEERNYTYVSNTNDGLITYSPEFDDSNFDGWYYEDTKWNLETDVVTTNIVLEARWK